MEIETTITADIINESLPLHYRHAPFKQRMLPYIYLSILLVIGLFQSLTSNDTGWLRWVNLIVLLVMGGLYTLWYLYKRNNAGKRMLKLYGENTHYTVNVSEDVLTFQYSYSHSENRWPAYPRAVIGKQMVLLYQQNGAYIIFHYSYFANEDFALFKNLVRRHMHEVKED